MPVTVTDPNPNSTASLDGPYENAATITKSDTDDLTYTTKAIFVGGAGNINLTTKGGQTLVITGIAAGSVLRIRATRVLSTNTTATNMVALW